MMNILLIFFALPIATIIISIALQKILKNPALVAAVIFAIFLTVTFVVSNLEFLIATIVYTIISFITALLVCIICRLLRRLENSNSESRQGDNNLIIASETNGYGCSNNQNSGNTNDNGVVARISVIPNQNDNSRSGCICGNYRRR